MKNTNMRKRIRRMLKDAILNDIEIRDLLKWVTTNEYFEIIHYIEYSPLRNRSALGLVDVLGYFNDDTDNPHIPYKEDRDKCSFTINKKGRNILYWDLRKVLKYTTSDACHVQLNRIADKSDAKSFGKALGEILVLSKAFSSENSDVTLYNGINSLIRNELVTPAIDSDLLDEITLHICQIPDTGECIDYLVDMDLFFDPYEDDDDDYDEPDFNDEDSSF